MYMYDLTDVRINTEKKENKTKHMFFFVSHIKKLVIVIFYKKEVVVINLFMPIGTCFLTS